jgi:hypothetical protein
LSPWENTATPCGIASVAQAESRSSPRRVSAGMFAVFLLCITSDKGQRTFGCGWGSCGWSIGAFLLRPPGGQNDAGSASRSATAAGPCLSGV